MATQPTWHCTSPRGCGLTICARCHPGIVGLIQAMQRYWALEEARRDDR